MEPSSNLPPDKAAAAQHNNPHHPQKQQHHMNPPARPSTSTSASSGLSTTGTASPAPGQAGIEKLCRPAAFDKVIDEDDGGEVSVGNSVIVGRWI